MPALIALAAFTVYVVCAAPAPYLLDSAELAAASFGLPPLAESYVAACVIPVLALPLMVKLCLKLSSLGRFIPQRS